MTSAPKPDTGPLGPLPTPATPPRNTRLIWLGALSVGITLLAVALFLLLRTDSLSDPRPAQRVAAFAAATEARDVTAMLNCIEPTVFRKEIGPELRNEIEYLEQVQFLNPTYTLLSNDGERATVRWQATMRYRLNLGSTSRNGERPIDTTVDLVYLEGGWYIRSLRLPEP